MTDGHRGLGTPRLRSISPFISRPGNSVVPAILAEVQEKLKAQIFH